MYATRRKALLEAIGTGVVMIPSAPVAIRNNDVEHDYRQSSDLYYLTGFDEPDSVLVLSSVHAEHQSVLFMPERDVERETWDGPRLGTERALGALGVDAAFPISELDERLPDYLQGAERVHYAIGRDAAFDGRFHRAMAVARQRARGGSLYPTEIVDPVVTLHEQRLRKEPCEMSLMREAARITRAGHLAAMQVALPGRYEYEVEAELLRAFRAGGSERPAYGSIVGSGPNATVLHYRKNNRQLQDGDLLLIDAGAEFDYYACDVTRTFPVSGRFTPAQRALYDIVLDSQLSAIAAVQQGATLDDVHACAVDVLVDGLLAQGILTGTRGSVLEQGSHRAYYMHRTSHWLGMDVHDVGSYHQRGNARPLEPGFVLTVEPGLYIREDAEEVDPRFRGIGIRIEDDVLVTPDGPRVLTDDIPKEAHELERLLTARVDPSRAGTAAPRA